MVGGPGVDGNGLGEGRAIGARNGHEETIAKRGSPVKYFVLQSKTTISFGLHGKHSAISSQKAFPLLPGSVTTATILHLGAGGKPKLLL